MNKKMVWILTGIYLSLLVAFVAWYLLDNFVMVYSISSVESVAAPAADTQVDTQVITQADTPTDTEAGSTEASVTETATETTTPAGKTVVTVTQEIYCDTVVYVAEVTLRDISDLRSVFAQDTYGRNVTETVCSMAERSNAVFAVNGDYYGARKTGYVIRNGILYRSKAASDQQDLCIWQDGSFTLIKERETSAQSLVDAGVWQVYSFGPGLIEDGQLIVGEDSEINRAMSSNPRTAIAMLEPLHYLFVVADGRTRASEGLTLYELAQFLQEKGAVVAYNLDGGGSSTMVYQNEVINYPTTTGRYSERAVSDIVGIFGE